MDESTPGTSTEPLSHRELQEACQRLRYLFHSVSIALLILTGVVFVFIYRQVAIIRQQTEQLAAEVAEFQNSGVPETIDELRRQLFQFAEENADFRPIYTRYFGTNAPPPPSGSGIMPASTNGVR